MWEHPFSGRDPGRPSSGHPGLHPPGSRGPQTPSLGTDSSRDPSPPGAEAHDARRWPRTPGLCPPLASRIPSRAGLEAQGHRAPGPPPLTDGGDVRGVELVVGEAAQQAGLAHPGVPDQQQPEQHVVLLRHGGGEAPGPGARRAQPRSAAAIAARACRGRRGRGGRRPAPRQRRSWVPGSAARRERGGRRARPPPAPALRRRGEGGGERAERGDPAPGARPVRAPSGGCAAREEPTPSAPSHPLLPGTGPPGGTCLFSADVRFSANEWEGAPFQPASAKLGFRGSSCFPKSQPNLVLPPANCVPRAPPLPAPAEAWW